MTLRSERQLFWFDCNGPHRLVCLNIWCLWLFGKLVEPLGGKVSQKDGSPRGWET